MTESRRKVFDGTQIVIGLAALVTIITRYQMPFRLDDVLYMQWAQHHSIWDAFNVQRGEIFMSVRPVISITFWLLTHYAGTEHYWIWHLVLAGSFMTAIGFTGLTARYISGQNTALYISSLWYWLAFLPILNILFWYADITFALEMMFCSIAWYFGLRALFEQRMGLWVVAMLAGILAAMTKEPSLLLIHGVLIGSIVLKRKELLLKFKSLPTSTNSIWLACYLIFLSVSLKLFFVSQAKQNRFFHIGSISSDQLHFFVTDRIRYYTEVVASLPVAIYLIISLCGIVLSTFTTSKEALKYIFGITIVSVLLFLFHKQILFPLLLIGFMIVPLFGNNRKKPLELLSLFAIIAGVNSLFLLITMMLVKTQLAELSFLISVLGASGVSIVCSRLYLAIASLPSKSTRNIIIACCGIGFIGAVFFFMPKLKAKEQLLRDVRSTRMNANNAIHTMARSLPNDATVAVTAPALYGIERADDMTSKDDEYKLYAQYTFLQGFIHAYFDVIGREDIHLAYLEDSTILHRVLDSTRSVGNHYLFLQTGLDVDRFHSKINSRVGLQPHDSLVAVFKENEQNGFASELWLLRR